MTTSPFDHPLLSGLLGDEEIAPLFAVDAEIREMIRFETALAEAEGAEGAIPSEAAAHIVARLETFAPNLADIRREAARDGTVGVEFVRQLRGWVGPPHDAHVHFGATSQDLVDTALILRLGPVLAIFARRLQAISGQIGELGRRFGSREIMGRTRMQDALPIAVAARLASWGGPLRRHQDRLRELTPRLLQLQFGGAVGRLDKLGDKGVAIATRLGKALSLDVPERSWHTQRDGVVEFGDWLALVSGSLGKIGADVGLMAQNSVAEIAISGGGGSSAMPHKQNPVGAEVLIALARYNATLTSGLQQTLVHEQERSGAAWTLEWLVLPQMVMTTAAGLRTAAALLGHITRIGQE